MKNKLSLASFFLIFSVAVAIRIFYIQEFSKKSPFCLTTYDAFGYYMYLPAGIIYEDMTQLHWLDTINQQYSVVGGTLLYQTIKEPNGNHVYKYLGGIALLQMPFFLGAHALAPVLGYPADGFSLPYQYGLVVATFFYAFLGLYLLRRFLLHYFDDRVVALTLLLCGLATNWLQYVSVDSAMSHAYIFPLYGLILLLSRSWHESPCRAKAIGIGLVIGLATISRPTEAIMLFIPLLWNTHTKEAAAQKWALVRQFKGHIAWVVAGGVIGILPQLIYWKWASGHFVYNVGSKWYFLNPYFRVLFGFEKGWFVYTPVTILFVAGFWYLKGVPFRRSVIVFCLLNMWVITAWADWRYGASYSCRALMQSYPVFALALAAILDKIIRGRWAIWLKVLSAYLIAVNLFQIYQYNAGILRYDENNFEYYRKIYLNPQAEPFKRE